MITYVTFLFHVYCLNENYSFLYCAPTWDWSTIDVLLMVVVGEQK